MTTILLGFLYKTSYLLSVLTFLVQSHCRKVPTSYGEGNLRKVTKSPYVNVAYTNNASLYVGVKGGYGTRSTGRKGMSPID